jgi:hypothetical protein
LGYERVRFLVGLAALSLLSQATSECPLLCVVDDAQWLDRASAQGSVGVCGAEAGGGVSRGRGGDAGAGGGVRGLGELLVEGSEKADARALLASVIPGRLDQRVAGQLRAEPRGNPLAWRELPRGLSAVQLAGGLGLAGALSLSGKMEEAS